MAIRIIMPHAMKNLSTAGFNPMTKYGMRTKTKGNIMLVGSSASVLHRK